MREFRELWKQMAKDKSINRDDTFQYCILKTMAAKTEEKLSLAKHILQSAFTPITNENKLNCCKYLPYEAVSQASYKSLIRSTKDRPGLLLSVLETPEEIDKYNEITSAVYKLVASDINEYYSYLLVRTDLSQEQQLVQAAHAMGILGAELVNVHPSEFAAARERLTRLNLVVCGVPNLEELKGGGDYLLSNGYRSVHFVEPDIGNQITALVSEPIKSTKRRFMRRYKLLKYPKAETYTTEGDSRDERLRTVG